VSAVSEAAKERQRQAHRELYYWYRDHGLCPRCKTQFNKPGRVYCEKCAEKNNQATLAYRDPEANKQRCKTRYQEWKAKGICVTCGKRKAIHGLTQCDTCKKRNIQSQQVRKMKKRLAREASK